MWKADKTRWLKRMETGWVPTTWSLQKTDMFGDPIWASDKDTAIFHIVWSDDEKVLDECKKACCICDGSPCSGQVCTLDETYANCVNHTGTCIFYAARAAENLVIYGSDVSNAFGKAPLPQEGFYVYPDWAFHNWWTLHLNCPPIPPDHVVPVLKAVQGHPESPRLWERHIDVILSAFGFIPMVHKPCLYSGKVNGAHVLFISRFMSLLWLLLILGHWRFFAVCLMTNLWCHSCTRVSSLYILAIDQTQHYVKIICCTYVDCVCEKHISTWLKDRKISADNPVLLPSTDEFNKDISNLYPKVQAVLEAKMQYK